MVEHAFGTQLGNREFFIRRWRMEHASFVEVCNALPAGRLDYRPHPASRSAGELVALLVSVERSCVDLCATGRGSYNSSLRFHSESPSSALDAMVAAYQDSHHQLGAKLNQLDDATWNRPAWLTRGEQEI